MAEDIGDIGDFWDGSFPGLDAFGDGFEGANSIWDAGSEGGLNLGSLWSDLTSGINGMSTGTALLGLGGASALASLLGANAAKEAARIQAGASGSAADKSLQQFYTTRSDLAPFQMLGAGAVSPLAQLTGASVGGNPLTAPLTKQFDASMLEDTPGYKFSLEQGMKGIKNMFAARGLGGESGALGKGLIGFNQGLAGTTYNDQLKNYLAQNQQTYNMLSQLVQGGQNAATQVGNTGAQAVSAANNLNTSGAAATAAGGLGAAQSAGAGLQNIGNVLVTNSLLQGMFGGR